MQVLLSEVAPWKLALMEGVDAWIQIACPRLSIDWGEGFQKLTLTPYEALIALGEVILHLRFCRDLPEIIHRIPIFENWLSPNVWVAGTLT